jgi:hypothetical protein
VRGRIGEGAAVKQFHLKVQAHIHIELDLLIAYLNLLTNATLHSHVTPVDMACFKWLTLSLFF